MSSSVSRDKRVRIEVITICKDNLPGLRATVESIDGQTRPPDAVHVVDGMSTDGTVEWWQGKARPSYYRFSSASDNGIYDALNRGLSALGTCWVMFLNSGDAFADADVLHFVDQQIRERSFDWAYGDSLLDVAGDHHLHALRHLARPRFMLGLGTVPHQATVMSSDLIRRIGIFRQDLGNAADQEHILRAWSASAPIYLRRALAVCESQGVSSQQGVGAFARQMSHFRRLHGVDLGRLDPVVTSLAVLFDRVKAWRREGARPIRARSRWSRR